MDSPCGSVVGRLFQTSGHRHCHCWLHKHSSKPRYFSGPQCPRVVSGPQSPCSVSGPQCPRIVFGPQRPCTVLGPQRPRSMFGPQCPRVLSGPQCPSTMSGPQCPRLLSGPQRPSTVFEPQCSIIYYGFVCLSIGYRPRRRYSISTTLSSSNLHFHHSECSTEPSGSPTGNKSNRSDRCECHFCIY